MKENLFAVYDYHARELHACKNLTAARRKAIKLCKSKESCCSHVYVLQYDHKHKCALTWSTYHRAFEVAAPFIRESNFRGRYFNDNFAQLKMREMFANN